ncbi:hypothetical protein QJQ45_012968 [Haematococcus lacustris]|nr:hypothetical protein QJQ45_012968 [Haematococcus lacustris]
MPRFQHPNQGKCVLCCKCTFPNVTREFYAWVAVGVHQGEDGMEVAWRLRHEALRLKGTLTRAPEYKLCVIGPASVVDSQLKAACEAKDLALIAHHCCVQLCQRRYQAANGAPPFSQEPPPAARMGSRAQLLQHQKDEHSMELAVAAIRHGLQRAGQGATPKLSDRLLQLPSFHPHPQLTPPTPELRPIPLHPHLAPLLVHPPLPPPPPPPSAPAPARVKANVDEAAEALRRQVRHLRLQLTRQRSTSVIMPTSKHATIAQLAIKHVKSPHQMRQLLSTAGLLAPGQGKGGGCNKARAAAGSNTQSQPGQLLHLEEPRKGAGPRGWFDPLHLMRALKMKVDTGLSFNAMPKALHGAFAVMAAGQQLTVSVPSARTYGRSTEAIAHAVTKGQAPWEVVQPIFLEARRYYCHRMGFLDLMPYRFAQLGDTDSTARQRAAWAVLGHFSCGGMDMFERPPSKELVGDLLRTYLLGVLSSRLEELLALLYKPAHITNAACETALKPLSSSGVEKMSPEQVAAHVKAHTEDLDTWVPHITRESLAQSRVEDRVAKRQRKEDKQAAAVAFFGIASPSLATAHPSPVAAAATPSPTAGAATSKRSVGSITISLASLEARSACGQTATMQQEEAKQYAADKATDKGRHLQAVALYRCKLASNKLPPTTSKLLKNQLQELWAVVGNGQPTVKPVRNMHIADWLDALAMHMSLVTN